MQKINNLFVFLIIWLFLTSIIVLANGDHEYEIEEGRKLVESKISCDELNDEQLELIGEYYMEQMHPGEAHEAMHEMMGMEEGTEYHEQVHVNMAKTMYCGEGSMMGGGMMGMMGSGGMMDTKAYNYKKSGGMMNMMGSWPFSWFGMGIGLLYMVLFWGLIIWLIVWLINKYGKQTGKTESAMEILKKRFARGEINKKRFEEMKKELR
jgi:uncharacterized membrane protein